MTDIDADVRGLLVHVIPKPNEKEGLGVGWPQQKADMDELKKYCEEM